MSCTSDTCEKTIKDLRTGLAALEETVSANSQREQIRFYVLICIQAIVAVCTAITLILYAREIRQSDEDRNRTMLTTLEVQAVPYSHIKPLLGRDNSFDWRGVMVDLRGSDRPSVNEAIIVVINPHELHTGLGCLSGSLWIDSRTSKVPLKETFQSEDGFQPEKGVAYASGHVADTTSDWNHSDLVFLANCVASRTHKFVQARFVPFEPPSHGRSGDADNPKAEAEGQ